MSPDFCRGLLPVDLLPALSGDKPYHRDAWSPRHRLIVALHLAGSKNTEIAEKLDLHPGTVSQILNDPRALFEVEKFAEDVADKTLDVQVRLKLYANEALDEIVEEMRTARDVRVRQKAAFGLLDRAGYTPPRSDPDRGDTTLPESFVQRLEEATSELIAHDVSYKVVEPKPTEEQDDGPSSVL